MFRLADRSDILQQGLPAAPAGRFLITTRIRPMICNNYSFHLGRFSCTDPAPFSYQEDRFTVASIHMDPTTIQQTIDKVPPEFQRQWDPQAVGNEFASQVVFVGIFDG